MVSTRILLGAALGPLASGTATHHAYWWAMRLILVDIVHSRTAESMAANRCVALFDIRVEVKDRILEERREILHMVPVLNEQMFGVLRLCIN